MQVEPGAITVIDNGPGMPPETVTDILDFSSRVSSREAYVAPDRGAQGNALKTILAMPFVLDGAAGHVEICAHGLRHQIEFTVDALRQAPVIRHRHEERDVRNGTSITVAWPESAGSMLAEAEAAILTNRRRLHLAQPASRPHRHLVRRALRRARDRSVMAQVAAVGPHLPALVHAPAPRAPDRRVPDPRYRARPRADRPRVRLRVPRAERQPEAEGGARCDRSAEGSAGQPVRRPHDRSSRRRQACSMP